jgi:hypothetical protein
MQIKVTTNTYWEDIEALKVHHYVKGILSHALHGYIHREPNPTLTNEGWDLLKASNISQIVLERANGKTSVLDVLVAIPDGVTGFNQFAFLQEAHTGWKVVPAIPKEIPA